MFGRLSPLGSDGFFLAVFEYPVGFICLQRGKPLISVRAENGSIG
ncbi:hypothetical protein NMH_2068 [Neisseria meningitidis H44/76]|uniref:Uncharacterized protein n=1 Tax=Neisseria meningitidis serogroup B / serotype 15 (strain H44/76) TaxID=909420 RepID=E6MZQ2_NEIMH|nr:hypothetical protein NMH_2068 [Neisseria meningitidis H44/76]